MITAVPAQITPPVIGGIAVQAVGITVAAALIGKHPNTVRRWVLNGQLPAVRLPGGAFSIRVADLNNIGEPVVSVAETRP